MINFAVGPVQMDEEIRAIGRKKYHISAHRNFLQL